VCVWCVCVIYTGAGASPRPRLPFRCCCCSAQVRVSHPGDPRARLPADAVLQPPRAPPRGRAGSGGRHRGRARGAPRARGEGRGRGGGSVLTHARPPAAALRHARRPRAPLLHGGGRAAVPRRAARGPGEIGPHSPGGGEGSKLIGWLQSPRPPVSGRACARRDDAQASSAHSCPQCNVVHGSWFS